MAAILHGDRDRLPPHRHRAELRLPKPASARPRAAAAFPRSELFITTKVADTRLDKSQFMDSVERSLETIGLGPVDLLLIHWPSTERCRPLRGLYSRACGGAASWACPAHRRLELPDRPSGTHRAAARSGAIATDQVEIHPYMQSPKLASSLTPLASTLDRLPAPVQRRGRVGSAAAAHWRKTWRHRIRSRSRVPDRGRARRHPCILE